MHQALFAAMMLTMTSAVAASVTIKLYAAGSLKAALTETARAFEATAQGAPVVETTFAASGLLRERIETGEGAHLFASANLSHPANLAEQGLTSGPAVLFARNQLCALARPGLAVTTDTLLEVMLDAGTRLGTSTPTADPAGDYALALFAKAEAVRPGARAALEAKAQQLTGGPTSPKAPQGQNLYAWVLGSDKADVFLTYCTNGVLARKQMPALQMLALPAPLAVGAEYGLTVLKGAPKAAGELAEFIMSAAGQEILAGYGFGRAD